MQNTAAFHPPVLIYEGWNETRYGSDVIYSHPNLDFSSLPEGFFVNMSERDRALELTWLHGLANLGNTNSEIIIPATAYGKWGRDLLRNLASRLEAHLKKTVTYIRDPTIDAWRIGSADSFRKSMIMMYDDPDADEDDPDALMDTQVEDGITAAMKRGVSVPLASPRVPRPPNSFILYRQHHHHKVTAENPGVRNTEISRIIAQMWHGEGAAVRARFKDLAEEKKRLHSQAHPNYQYAPRRPGEKLRRQSPRIRASSVPFFNKTAAGQARLKNAEENDDGWIDVDGDCIDIFDELGLMYGPSALPPIPSYDSPDFHAIVDMQCGERVGLQTVHYENLDGTEFEPGFPMDTLLALPGA